MLVEEVDPASGKRIIKSAPQIAKELEKEFGVFVSSKTILIDLRCLQMHCRKRPRVPAMTEAHMANRVAFAQSELPN